MSAEDYTPADSAPAAAPITSGPSQEGSGPAAGGGDTPVHPDAWVDLATFSKYKEYARLYSFYIDAALRRDEAIRENAGLKVLNTGHQRLATKYRERAEAAEKKLARYHRLECERSESFMREAEAMK